MPDGFSEGSREWSGSATFDAATGAVALHYTAAGRRGERPVTFEQRIVAASARLRGDRSGFDGWRSQGEPFAADGLFYRPATDRAAEPGFLTAFRDPYPFRDPATGRAVIVFAASAARAGSRYDGAIGLAAADGRGGWRLAPPPVAAPGVNAELERPHLVHRDGRYYLFWSTQAHTFAPGLGGRTGLYGMVADTLAGPYRPLNGGGAVLVNPADTPSQTYA